MKAIRVYLDETDTEKVGGVVEMLNEFEDTVATMVGAQELFIATVGICGMAYAVCVLETEFNKEITIQYVK